MRALIRNIYLQVAGFFKKPAAGIHIINAHYVTPFATTPGDAAVFEDFVRYLSKKTKLVTVQEATERIIRKDFPTKEAWVAFTFDDGFSECHDIIAPILEKYGTNGAFFINAHYAGSGESYQAGYNERVNTFTKKPMDWEQIQSLHQRGHVIGSHTLDHVNLAETTKEALDLQLSENKRILEEKLGYQCDYFAWTYGRLEHFPDEALDAASRLHPYIFSGTDYKHYFSRNGKVINRRHIEPFWPKQHIDYFLSVNKAL